MNHHLEMQNNKYTIYLACLLLIVFSFSCFGCSYMSKKPDEILLLSTEPMSHTAISSYLPISTLYASDAEFYLIALWHGKVESKNHVTRWEIHDDSGKKIFTSNRQNFTIQSDMFTLNPVLLEDLLVDGLTPEKLTAHFYIDDQLALSKAIEYKNMRIDRSDMRQVTILPFVEDNDYPAPWGESAKNLFQNTVADAIYCEVGRVFQNATPHYVAEQKISKHIDPNCYKDPACVSFLKKAFGDNVLIFGNLSIQQVDLDSSRLTVHVYDLKTAEFKTFQHYRGYDFSYPKLIRDLLSGVLYKRGLLEFLKKM